MGAASSYISAQRGKLVTTRSPLPCRRLLRVESFGVARQSIADPDVGGASLEEPEFPPLKRPPSAPMVLSLALGSPNMLAQKPKTPGARKIAESAVGNLDQGVKKKLGSGMGPKHV